MKIAIIGGGISGLFAAITCAENYKTHELILFEREATLLSRFKRSAGGRGLFTNRYACAEDVDLYYVNGQKEMIGPLYTWSVDDVIDWLDERAIPWEETSNGAIVGKDKDAEGIANRMVEYAESLGVQIKTEHSLVDSGPRTGGFRLWFKNNEIYDCEKLLFATGITQGGMGLKASQTVGHQVNESIPVMYTLHCADRRLKNLGGIAVSTCSVECNLGDALTKGMIEVTPKGLGGDAIVKLTCLYTDEMIRRGFEFSIKVDWLDSVSHSELAKILTQTANDKGSQCVFDFCPFAFPLKFWRQQLLHINISEEELWNGLSTKKIKSLASLLKSSNFSISGKSMNKSEWTCRGGVATSGIQFQTMESKHCKDIFFLGEMLDVDGFPGGFNSQLAWTTGYIAGIAAGE